MRLNISGSETFLPLYAGSPRGCLGRIALSCCCLASTVSSADDSFAESHAVLPQPAMEMEWKDHTRSENLLSRSPMYAEGRDACFAIGNRTEEQDKLRGAQGGPTLLLPMMRVCVGVVAAVGDIGWSGHEASGDHAKSLGHWVQAEHDYVTAVGILERTIDKEVNQDLAALLVKLGAARFMQQDYTGAETVLRRALTIYTSTRGAEDLRVADTLDLLAGVLFEQPQERALAGPLFFRAWVIREGVLIPDHPAIADSLHHVAIGLYSDNLSLAMPMLLRAKEIREKVFGHDHPLVAVSLSAMARMYEAHHHRDLAIPIYQDVLRIQEKVFGPSASEAIQTRDYLNMAYRETSTQGGDPNGQQ